MLIRSNWVDPLERVWVAMAARVGLAVRRNAQAYAASDGRGVLLIGEPATLDADDSVAQLVFHELCHALVEGPAAFGLPDWGLDNVDTRDLAREHACLRVQAELANRYGLWSFMAPTTEHRGFYERLGPEPLAGCDLAVQALSRAASAPWAPHLDRALAATQAILELAELIGSRG